MWLVFHDLGISKGHEEIRGESRGVARQGEEPCACLLSRALQAPVCGHDQRTAADIRGAGDKGTRE